MAQNRRLIDANELYDQAHDAFYSAFHRSIADLTDLKELIEDAPTVDAAEVVRCRDCRHSEVWGTEKRVGHEATYSRVCLCFWRLKRVKDDDFCSYGGRRDDNG